MKICIICGYPIPYGMAATTRIFSYSKGLVACGDNVDVCSVITTNHSLDIANEGVFDKGSTDSMSVSFRLSFPYGYALGLINLYLVRINHYLRSAAHLDDIALVGLSDYGCRTVAFPRGQQPAMLAVILKFFSVVVIVIVHISVFI